ncbi:hypothetical protein [Flavihumibacter fluvii]|uniref:hypothetical protein n=1 Tax=Flavihumibacter fluvii TaxID=2838157 RepID=UPI001BDEA961|nr:hypothetical protein [Flavihumibacter fluvii]ULQ54390.1 hypothetical protein KJS93_08675 [Flavihumibacter fluvii]
MELNKTIPFYFRQPALESVSIPELQKAISRFPYCACLQYLLLKKQKIEQDPAFNSQLNKAYLYFPNVYRLHSLLQEKSAIPHVPVLEYTPKKEEFIQEPVLAPLTAEEDESPELEVESGPEPALRTDLLLKESPIPIPSLKDISPQTDELPIFEPYHTIDYFASQGIKLSHELPVNDRLGRQLRSFTDWIKTMKKLPQADLEHKLDEVGMGERIVAMAAGSVLPREVVTETMAEVLVKQGNFGGAIDLYHKLSLAHPDKSAYFAARIDHLNKLR